MTTENKILLATFLFLVMASALFYQMNHDPTVWSDALISYLRIKSQ